jgi:cysteine-rich repeat protein
MSNTGWARALAIVVLSMACSDPDEGERTREQPGTAEGANDSTATDAGPGSGFGNRTGDAGEPPARDAGASQSGSTAERCADGLDNDDDSMVDEQCMCLGAATQACYGGPAEQAGVGVCTRGEQSCETAMEFPAWGGCTGWVPAGDEECNELDDDCDGSVDEDCSCTGDEERSCYTGPAATEDVGICHGGMQTCEDGAWSECEGEVTPGEAESCDDPDDEDCDGSVDEGCESCPEGTQSAVIAFGHGGVHADILILDRSVTGGVSSQEALAAAANGFSVDVVDDATWSAMSIADFASYRAIVLGDANCDTGQGADRLSAASANTPVWGAAVTGNVILIGTDQTYHQPYGQPLNQDGIAFAAARPGQTGAFVSLACDYHDTTPNTPVPYLAGLGTGFAVGPTPDSCFNDAYVVAAHPALANVTSESLSNWSCSVHEVFNSWPSNYEVLAIARHAGGSFTAADGTLGTPYILARGVIPNGCGNGSLQAAEECDDGNNENGDGCDEACNVEVCGDRVLQAGEGCDDGNTTRGDGCSPTCQIEFCFVAECGDGAIQRGEQCDDGDANSNSMAGACRLNCSLPRCGDSVTDPGEQCDEGPANSTAQDACRPGCRLARCGDLIIDSQEQCDDGNTNDGDGCDGDCSWTCFQVTATVSEHESAGRAYSTTTGLWPFQTTRWYAQGTGEDLGTNGNVSVTLHELPFGSGSWSSGSCP